MTIRKVDGGYVHSQAWPTAGEPDYAEEYHRLKKVLFRAEWALLWALDKVQGTKLFKDNSPPVIVLKELLEELYDKPTKDEK